MTKIKNGKLVEWGIFIVLGLAVLSVVTAFFDWFLVIGALGLALFILGALLAVSLVNNGE